jgi:hypothetical protein
MKVKPWAGVDETLQALHAVLVAKQGCPRFWPLLRELLATLSHDLRQREQGEVLDNEILQPDRYASLLDEIRAAAASTPPGPGTFGRLSATLSLPAAALLCLLAGVATVGCASNSLPVAKDAGAEADSGTSKDAARDAAAGLRLRLDAAPVDRHPSPDAPACGEAGSCTVEDVMRACGFGTSDERAQVTSCLDRLKASWRAQMPSALTEYGGCSSAIYELNCFIYGNSADKRTCRDIAADREFNERDMCAPIPVYLGVRFV